MAENKFVKANALVGADCATEPMKVFSALL